MKRFWVIPIALMLIAIPIYAHHSGAGVDRTKTVIVEGTVKAFKWGNPHSWLESRAPSAARASTAHTCASL